MSRARDMAVGVKLILIPRLAESNAVNIFSECFEESKRLGLDSPSVPVQLRMVAVAQLQIGNI